MTYARLLCLFLVPALAAAFALARPRLERRHALFLLGLTAVVLAWTSPWDNAAVAMGLWSFAPDKISGVRLGRLPLEEYAFFLLQTWTAALAAIWRLRK